MSKLKDDVKEMQKETQDIKKSIKQPSLAMDILRCYKRDNQILKALLLISILVNVLIVVLKW